MGLLSHVAAAVGGAIVMLFCSNWDFSQSQVRNVSHVSHALRAISDLKIQKQVHTDAVDPLPVVFWNNSVLPPNIVSQRLTVVKNPFYGHHVFALGLNGSVWHKFQTGPEVDGNLPHIPMSPWHCLTPNSSLIFGNDPAAAINEDGHIELFVAYKADSYDLWQMYQTDARNPLAWTKPRGPTCMCADPDPAKCPWCVDCAQREECMKNYWFPGAPPFTTSDMEVLLNPEDEKLRLYYRNFDGHMYYLQQEAPNKSDKWQVGGMQMAIFE